MVLNSITFFPELEEVSSGSPVDWNAKWAKADMVALEDLVLVPRERKPASERDSRIPSDVTAHLYFHSFPEGKVKADDLWGPTVSLERWCANGIP